MAMSEARAWLGLRRGVSLLLAIGLVLLAAPAGLAASVGIVPSAVVDSATMTFVKLATAVDIFTDATKPTTGYVTVASGTWLMLATTDTYTVTVTDTTVTPNVTTATEYGCIYYSNTRYNVLWSDVKDCIQTDAQVLAYVTGTLWTTTDYPSLKPEMNLKRDVRVYGLQLALRTLGYYSGTLDGSYGDLTIASVKSFQRAYKLDVDGYAGPYTQKVLYPLAISAYASSGTTVGSVAGTLKTTVSLNLRKTYSTKSARLAVVPKKTTLAYTKTVTSGGVKWYYVTYNSISGWLLGTYVSADGSSTGSTTTETVLGTVKATTNAVVRKTANGTRTGYLLSKGSTASLIGTAVTAGGYSWYYVKLSNGVKGYIRGDCITVTYDSGGGVTPSAVKVYVQVAADAGLVIFTTEEAPAAGATTGFTVVPKGAVLQLVSTDTYTKNSVQYCSLYYNNTRYNVVYSDVSGIMMSTAAVTTYITGTIWPAGYTMAGKLKEDLNLKGNIMVHSLQYALTILGYYTGSLDGNFGSDTTAAVKNFQKNHKMASGQKLDVDGDCGADTSGVLYPLAIAAVTGVNTGDFGTITSIQKATWNFGDAGGSIFAKSATAMVMDVATQKVFAVKRWSGQYHADCVPLTEADTKIMCSIVGFTYNSSRPSSSQLTQIIGDSDSSTYTWPDFKGTWSGSSIGSAWDRRPALLNVGGKVYCVSIYGWPHGYSDVKNFSPSPSVNNYYGMMCVHFTGSYTHVSGNVDSGHQAAIQTAYNFAKAKWPSLTQ